MSRGNRKDRRRQKEDSAESSLADAPAQPASSAEVAGPVASPPADPPPVITRDITPQQESLDSTTWPEHPWPAAEPRGSGFQVVLRRSVLNAIHNHGAATPEVEICGVLVGNVYRDQAGAFLLVEAMIRGDFAGSANAQVTFTAETWSHIQSVMEAQHPQQKIVGWYHTHPDFSIFLSDMDLFIHGNFFNMPWQVAFVFDPINNEEGVFVWRDGKTERASFCVEEDVEKELVTVPVSTEITAAALADFSRRMQQMERRQKRVMVALPFLFLLMVAWPFILFTAMSERGTPNGTAMPVTVVPVATTTASKPALVINATQPTVTVATPPVTQPIALAVHVPPATTSQVPTTVPVPTPADKLFTPSVLRPTPSTGPKILDNTPDSGPH
jgi:proteasome lid subunit RPN8/RPN11